MPKKYKGLNSKAVEAKERKSVAKALEDKRKQQDVENAHWADDDKHVARKQQRKDDKEKRRYEQLEHKKELHRLADEEMSYCKESRTFSTKLSRAQIHQHRESLAVEAEAPVAVPYDERPIEENLNRALIIGNDAHSVEEAISIFGAETEIDRHPEKRVKAAFETFQDARLSYLKMENPNLRLSQLKQIVKKEWQKSTENPLNHRLPS